MEGFCFEMAALDLAKDAGELFCSLQFESLRKVDGDRDLGWEIYLLMRLFEDLLSFVGKFEVVLLNELLSYCFSFEVHLLLSLYLSRYHSFFDMFCSIRPNHDCLFRLSNFLFLVL